MFLIEVNKQKKGCFSLFRAKDEIRTRDPHLGKVMLYQLSYFRLFQSKTFVFKSVCKDSITSIFANHFVFFLNDSLDLAQIIQLVLLNHHLPSQQGPSFELYHHGVNS